MARNKKAYVYPHHGMEVFEVLGPDVLERLRKLDKATEWGIGLVAVQQLEHEIVAALRARIMQVIGESPNDEAREAAATWVEYLMRLIATETEANRGGAAGARPVGRR